MRVVTARQVSSSAVVAGILTALPVVGLRNAFWNPHTHPLASGLFSVLAFPGVTLSSLLGVNDKWGIPNVIAYSLGCLVFWLAVALSSTLVVRTLRERSGAAT